MLYFLSTLALVSPVLSAFTLPFGQIGADNAVLFFNGFHFVNGEISHQMQANHHCAIVRDDFIQCVIYDSHYSPSRLRGIEYITNNETFQTFSTEEKQLWHSHFTRSHPAPFTSLECRNQSTMHSCRSLLPPTARHFTRGVGMRGATAFLSVSLS